MKNIFKHKTISRIYFAMHLIVLLFSICFFGLQLANVTVGTIDNHYFTERLFKMSIYLCIPYVLAFVDISITKTAQIYFFFALASHFIGGDILGFYCSVPWYNSVLHFANSMFVGILFYNLIDQNVKTKSKLLKIVLVIACVALSGLLWEILEFLLDGWFGRNMQRHHNSITGEAFISREALVDTMSDIILDLTGGICATILSVAIKIKNKCLHEYFALTFNVGNKKISTNAKHKIESENSKKNVIIDEDDEEQLAEK